MVGNKFATLVQLFGSRHWFYCAKIKCLEKRGGKQVTPFLVCEECNNSDRGMASITSLPETNMSGNC